MGDLHGTVIVGVSITFVTSERDLIPSSSSSSCHRTKQAFQIQLSPIASLIFSASLALFISRSWFTRKPSRCRILMHLSNWTSSGLLATSGLKPTSYPLPSAVRRKSMIRSANMDTWGTRSYGFDAQSSSTTSRSVFCLLRTTNDSRSCCRYPSTSFQSGSPRVIEPAAARHRFMYNRNASLTSSTFTNASA
ncbi:hypothetical protein K445DRAFT_96890 [Daldinia sp. EC12]|nr:hypothetical protein K445DRAFT_96890 [Daldinia sp. EC12]